MTAGVILVLAVLVSGGLIAIVSDRLGSKVGKARLTLFKLRPRNTAILVTVITGSILSALTLIILFSASKPLRTGVFRVDELQNSLRYARKELAQSQAELVQIKEEQAEALTKLEMFNRSSQKAIAQQTENQAKLKVLQKQLSDLRAEKARLEMELRNLQQELKLAYDMKAQLRIELEKLEDEKQKLLDQNRD